jgi:hypothetical protein
MLRLSRLRLSRLSCISSGDGSASGLCRGPGYLSSNCSLSYAGSLSSTCSLSGSGSPRGIGSLGCAGSLSSTSTGHAAALSALGLISRTLTAPIGFSTSIALAATSLSSFVLCTSRFHALTTPTWSNSIVLPWPVALTASTTLSTTSLPAPNVDTFVDLNASLVSAST